MFWGPRSTTIWLPSKTVFVYYYFCFATAGNAKQLDEFTLRAEIQEEKSANQKMAGARLLAPTAYLFDPIPELHVKHGTNWLVVRGLQVCALVKQLLHRVGDWVQSGYPQDAVAPGRRPNLLVWAAVVLAGTGAVLVCGQKVQFALDKALESRALGTLQVKLI